MYAWLLYICRACPAGEYERSIVARESEYPRLVRLAGWLIWRERKTLLVG